MGSCSQNKLQGTWILAYTDTPTSISGFNEVFTFDDIWYVSETYAGRSYYEKSNGKFELTKEFLILNDSIRLTVKYVNQDSLEISDESSSYILKKLNDSLKINIQSRIELIGKTFISAYEGENKALIHFMKDQLKLHPDTEKESIIHYKRINHNGFDIIFQENAAPKIIHRLKKDTLQLLVIHKKLYNLKMWEK